MMKSKECNGILVVNKEKGYTSRDVVNIVAKKFETKRVGHTGTLDPIATGVLVLAIGKATKIVEVLTNHDKEYVAKFVLGIRTDTLDITGNVLEECEAVVEKEKVIECLKKFKVYEQTVPIYSAVRINGKKLYEYARRQEQIELPKRLVEIKKIKLIDYEVKNGKTIVTIKTEVSKGTYIRSLIAEICK